jgi:FdhD protein
MQESAAGAHQTAMESTGPGSRHVPVTTCSGTTRDQHRDLVAIEAPLEVRVNGERFAVMMRTPGADRPLALGFLFSEGVIGGRADVAAVDVWPDDPVLGNRVNVIVAERAARALREHPDERRHVAVTSACGLCGRVSIESLTREVAPLPRSWSVDAAWVASISARLREAQPVFDGTGGLHAAALFVHDGEVTASAEDVGRHNAVDKIVGTMLDEHRLPLEDFVLAVSGRASFELVQKACLAGIPMLVAVSAPSSLAIDLANACGITLVGFARGERFNIYTHPERIAEPPVRRD